MKKFISILTALVMTATLFPLSVSAKDSGEKLLKVDENGSFKILQVSDSQDHATADGKKRIKLRTLDTIRLAVATESPDLIVLTGDNIHRADSLEDFEFSVKKLVSTFKGTPFAVTYGNHDLERNKDKDENLTYKQEQEIYEKYGALKLNQSGLNITDNTDYSTSKYGTGYLDIYNAEGTKVVNRVILLNSGTYEVEASESDRNVVNDGEGYGRPGVNAKTYKNTDYSNIVNAVKQWTGEGIKCISYQHIPLQEFFTSGIIVECETGGVIMNGRQPEPFKDKRYKNTVKDVKTNQFVEPCGCSYYSTEALYRAFAENGNTLAVCYGHDHTNTIMAQGECYGMKLTQGYGGGLLVYPGDYAEDSPEADYNPMVCIYTVNGDSFTKQTKPFHTLLRTYLFNGFFWQYITDSIKALFN